MSKLKKIGKTLLKDLKDYEISLCDLNYQMIEELSKDKKDASNINKLSESIKEHCLIIRNLKDIIKRSEKSK